VPLSRGAHFRSYRQLVPALVRVLATWKNALIAFARPALSQKCLLRISWATDGEDEAAIAAEPLDRTRNTHVSSGRSHSTRNMEFVERTMHTHADHAEQFTKDTFEANRKALECIRESMEQAQHARTEATRARQRFDKLLSVSLRHREHLQAKHRGVEDDVNTSLRNAIDVQHKQAEYECRLHSDVLTAEERQEIKPPLVSSWRLRSGMYPASTSQCVDDNSDSQSLGVSVSVLQHSPTRSHRSTNLPRMGVREWVSYSQAKPPLLPSEHSDRFEASADSDFGPCASCRQNPAVIPHTNYHRHRTLHVLDVA
jgi:hypothetical protein